VVVVTHEHELVNRFSKRVIRIEHGKVVADSNPPQEWEPVPSAAADGEDALNRLAEEQRRQTGAAWGTDANLHVSLEHLQSGAEPAEPAEQSVPMPVCPEEPAEEPWEDTADEPFVTNVRRKSNVPSWLQEAPAVSAEDLATEQVPPVTGAPEETAVSQPEEQPEPVQPEVLPMQENEEQSAEEQPHPAARLGDPDHTTTMEDVDELLRHLLNG
jgi:ABC-type sulfate/molybdate transport systems ATPase subunit